jgi:hypothetical protein
MSRRAFGITAFAGFELMILWRIAIADIRFALFGREFPAFRIFIFNSLFHLLSLRIMSFK